MNIINIFFFIPFIFKNQMYIYIKYKNNNNINKPLRKLPLNKKINKNGY